MRQPYPSRLLSRAANVLGERTNRGEAPLSPNREKRPVFDISVQACSNPVLMVRKRYSESGETRSIPRSFPGSHRVDIPAIFPNTMLFVLGFEPICSVRSCPVFGRVRVGGMLQFLYRKVGKD